LQYKNIKINEGKEEMQSGYINILSRFVCFIITSHLVYEASSTDVLNATEPSLYSAKRLF